MDPKITEAIGLLVELDKFREKEQQKQFVAEMEIHNMSLKAQNEMAGKKGLDQGFRCNCGSRVIHGNYCHCINFLKNEIACLSAKIATMHERISGLVITQGKA